MRHFIVDRYDALHGDNFTGNQAETCVLAVLKAFLKEQLHAQTDAEKGLSLSSLRQHYFRHAAFPELFCRVSKSADPGKNQFIRLLNHRRIAGENSFLSDISKGTFQGKDISHAVIYNGNHLQHSLRRRNLVFIFLVNFYSFCHGSSKSFKHSLDDVMGVLPCHLFKVQGQLCLSHKS